MRRLLLAIASLLVLASALTLSGLAASAATLIIRPTDWGPAPGEWHEANARDGGVSVVSDVRDDRLGGDGSLDQRLPAPAANSPKTDAQIFSPDTVFAAGAGFSTTAGGFGLLSELDTIHFDWLRASSSTAPAHLTPALRLWLWDPDVGTNGTSTLAIWEGIYNGYPTSGGPVPTDVWTAEDLNGDNFWQIPQFIDGSFSGIGGCGGPIECFVFDRDLTEWGYGPNTQVFGVEVGLGSGWAGSYEGAADLITLGFNGAEPTTWDFEPDRPELSLTSAISPGSLDLGSDINTATATLTLSNAGTAMATGGVVVDTIPTGTTLTAINNSGFPIQCSGDGASFGPCPADPASVVAIEWTVGALDATDPPVNVGYTLTIDLPVVGSPFANAPTVASDQTTLAPGTSFSLPVQPAPTTTTTAPSTTSTSAAPTTAETTTPSTTAPSTTAAPTTPTTGVATTAAPTSEARPPAVDDGSLPNTGSNPLPLLLAGLTLLAAGLALASAAWRSRIA